MSDWYSNLPKASPLDAAIAAEGVSDPTLIALADSIYAQESRRGQNAATSNAGAVGGMQVLKKTFREVADRGWDIDDPVDNARAGLRYLQKMFHRADGDVILASVGYYGGPGGQDKARRGEAVSDPRNPQAPNTLEYAKQVVARMGQAEKSGDSSPKGAWWLSYPVASGKTAPAPESATPRASDAGGQPEQSGQSLPDQLLRQAGLTVRAGVQGVLSLPGMLTDGVTGPVNAGLDAVAGQGNGFRFEKAAVATDRLLDAVGLPKPQTATERVIQDAAGAAAGGAGVVGAGRALAGVAAGAGKAVGQALASGPGLQATSAATGAGLSGSVREGGGSDTAQALAGLAGAMVPAVGPAAAGAAVRGALRGGAEGQAAAAGRLAAFDAVGAQPTLGQVTGGKTVRQVENVLARVPGSAGPLNEFAESQARKLEQAVTTLATELAPGASAMTAGEAITRGIAGFKQGMRAVQDRLYRTLDQHIAPDAPVAVDNTMRSLASLNALIDGAENTSRFFVNGRLGAIEQALEKDLAAAADAGGVLPFQAVKKLRTLIGREIGDVGLMSDVPRSKWTEVYRAISDDLGAAASAAGPEAEAVWKWANQFTKTQTERLEQLSGIVGRDAPEKVFLAATSGTAEGDTVARRVVSALPKQERREVAAALIQRMGRAAPGQQDAEGAAFSSEQFLSNLGRMSKAARWTLFGRTDVDGVLEQVENFARVAQTRREGGRVFNGTGEPLLGSRMGVGTLVGGAGAAAALGQPGPLAAALAVPVAARAGAGIVTSQGLARMAATPTSLADGAGAALLNAAGQSAADLPPPMDSRGTFAKIADAKNVDDAIRAFEGDDPAIEARTKSEALRLEVERAKRHASEAKAARIAAEQEALQARRIRSLGSYLLMD